MTSTLGVDYSSGRPGGAALAAAGMRFAARYLSHTESKNLTAAEAADLAAHGVACVVVWETTANRAAAGRNAGVQDATEAVAQAKTCGQPATRPIYFAVDWDANPSEVVAYFQGVASVIGLSRTGVYGGYRVVRYLLDHDLARWAWQTAAWSGGQWDPRAVLHQPATTTRIAGVDCDHDTATAADYGQWTPGKTPTLEDIVTPEDIKAIAAASAAATADAILGRQTDDPTTSDNSTKRLLAIFWDMGKNAAQANTAATRLLAEVAALNAAVAKLAAGGGLTAAEITSAAQAGATAALDQLGTALTTPKGN